MKRAAAKPAHTPGPWAIQQHVKHGWFVITADGSEVAGALGLKNALLVSAAPDLLQALQAMSSSFHGVERMEQHMQQAAEMARAAIVKATGEPA